MSSADPLSGAWWWGVWLKWLLGSSLPEVIDYIFPRTFMALDVVDKYYDFKWSWVKSI